jgi:hypothetical protein
MADNVAVMRGTINDSPWGNMEITDASFSAQSASSSSPPSSKAAAAAAAAARNKNRSNAYVVRASAASEHDGHSHDFLIQNEPEINNNEEEDIDEDDECCLSCCSRRRWRMRFLHVGSLVDFLWSILLLVYGGILAHRHYPSRNSSTTTTTEQVLCSALIWTGILFLLRVVFWTIAVTCQRLSRRAGGIDAHDVGCCQGCSLVAVVYIFTPLLVLTFLVSSAAAAIFHQPLLTCLSQLLQEIKQEEHAEAPRLSFTARYFIVPILDLSVQHSHWIWLLFLVLCLIEFLRRKLYIRHYEEVYKQEEASMVPSWQRRHRAQQEEDGGSRPDRQSRRFFSSSDGRPWWWDRSRSFRTRRRAPAVGNEILTEALLQDDYTNTSSVGRQQHRHSPLSQQRRGRGRSWWRMFSRGSGDDDDHDNIRDDGSVDFASVQEEWEIRSQGNPTWWAQDDDDDLGFLPPARAEATDLSWAEQQQQRQQRNEMQ